MIDGGFTFLLRFECAADPETPFDPATCTVDDLETALADGSVWPVEIIYRGETTVVPPEESE